MFLNFPNTDWEVKSPTKHFHRYSKSKKKKNNQNWAKLPWSQDRYAFINNLDHTSRVASIDNYDVLSWLGLRPIDLNQMTQGLVDTQPLLSIHRFETQFQLLSSNFEGSWRVVIVSVHWSMKLYHILYVASTQKEVSYLVNDSCTASTTTYMFPFLCVSTAYHWTAAQHCK